MSESDLVKSILSLLSLKGIRAFRNNTGRRGRISFGLCPGSSDIIGYTRDGKFLAIECKDGPKSLPTQEQVDFLADVNKAGGIGILAYSIADVVSL